MKPTFFRRAINEIYYISARFMPLHWEWQWLYTMRARVYFENFDEPDFSGWPWAWRLSRFEDDLGEELIGPQVTIIYTGSEPLTP